MGRENMGRAIAFVASLLKPLSSSTPRERSEHCLSHLNPHTSPFNMCFLKRSLGPPKMPLRPHRDL